MAEFRSYSLEVTRTAHYHTFGDVRTADHVIIALHGYGQLASRLIRKFESLSDCFVIAPEGLSSFYWKGVQGEVVASWMTSHHREDEISDYLRYLDKLFKLNEADFMGKKVHLFGFSQGCATLWRWLEAHRPQVTSLCLWAGWLPEDVDYGYISTYLGGIDIRFIYGKNDEYLTEERMEIFKSRVKAENLKMEIIRFEGTHRVDRGVLTEWYEKL